MERLVSKTGREYGLHRCLEADDILMNGTLVCKNHYIRRGIISGFRLPKTEGRIYAIK